MNQPAQDQDYQDNAAYEQSDTEDNIQDLRRSRRDRKLPHYLKDYQVNGSLTINNSCQLKPTNQIKANYKTIYPIDSVVSYDGLSKEHLHYTLTITANHEPQSYTEASKTKE